jgi:hypothetical protein
LGAADFGWAFAPNPVPAGEQLRESAQVLKDTQDRLLHELFWFWPASYPAEGADVAMTALLAGDADTAFLHWQNAAAAGQIVAVHNLAIFHHLVALEGERVGAPIEQETMEWWRAAIGQWQQVCESDEFWERLSMRVRLLADARVPAELPSLIRATLPAAWCGIHASLAIARAKKAQWHETSAHVAFARQVHTEPGRAERALEGAIAQVVQGLDLVVRDNARRLNGDGSAGLALTAALLAEAADELELIETVCGRESEVYREVSTRVVDAALEGVISYQRSTLDSCGVLPWLTHLTTLAASPEVRRRLEDTADILHSNAISEKLPPVDPNEDPAATELAEFEAGYLLLLEEFVPGAVRLNLGERARAEYMTNVRRALRELAHAACYQLEHFDLAARALASAADISEGAEHEALLAERELLLVEIGRRKACRQVAEDARAASEGEPVSDTVASEAPPAEPETVPGLEAMEFVPEPELESELPSVSEAELAAGQVSDPTTDQTDSSEPQAAADEPAAELEVAEGVRQPVSELEAEPAPAPEPEPAAEQPWMQPEAGAPAAEPEQAPALELGDQPPSADEPANLAEAPESPFPGDAPDPGVADLPGVAAAHSEAAPMVLGNQVQSELPLWQDEPAQPAEPEAAALAAAPGTPEAPIDGETGAPVSSEAVLGVPEPASLRAWGSDQMRYEHNGHLVEINPTRLVFDTCTLLPEEITGLRYGVVDVDTPEGVVRAHRIDWCDSGTVVTLDETNLFAGDAEMAGRHYNLILEVIYGVAVPGLIVRMVEWVQRGESVPLDAARLRGEGFAFSGRTFHWPSEATVPYSQLLHTLDGGDLVVTRSGEETQTERYPLNEVWNAAIVGHVIDALANSTPTNQET